MSMPCQQCGLLHPAGTPCFTLTLPAQGGAAGLQPGTVLAGRYAILRTIHRGGMSVVYLAEDRVQGRQVALKELRLPEEGGADQPGYAEAEAWFARESYLLSTLSHPLIPEFYSVFREGGHSYIAQEYVQGENLQELIARRGPIEERQVAAWGRALCGLLSYLHGSHLGGPLPVVFRDLKPANILVCRSGAELTVVDFGIAKPYRPVPHCASPGTVLGTPGYAAPEQYQGFATPQSDIYALGATLHRALTGYDPERGTPFVFPPIRSLNPAVSPALAEAVERALRLNPAERFATAEAFDAALARATGRGYPPRVSIRPTASWAQHAWLVASLILVVPLVSMGIFRSSAAMPTISPFAIDASPGSGYIDNATQQIAFNASCQMQANPSLHGSTYIISGPEHRLWFIEPGGDMIGSITTAGVISDCALSETGGSPSSLALGVGDSLWITQSDADAIVEMTPDGLLHPYQLAAHTHPGCITRGADGAMWFIASGLGTIGRIAGDGTVRYFPLRGISGVPDGLVAGPDGQLWFPEYQTNRIGQLGMHGQVSEVVGSRTIGDGTMGMIGDPRSRAFWFTSGSQIFRVAENGTTTAFQSNEGDQEFADITTGADGKLLWWADDRTGAVGWINQDGAISGFALPHANVQPSSIIAGPDGNMWFSESHGGAIGRVTPDGTITEFGGN